MEVIVAKTAGFCFGVKRAVDKVYEQIEKGGSPIYTYGPIIHNEEVVKDLEAKGVRVLETEEELAALERGVVIIRSHGVGRHIYELLDRPGDNRGGRHLSLREEDSPHCGGTERGGPAGHHRGKRGASGGPGNKRLGRYQYFSHRKR